MVCLSLSGVFPWVAGLARRETFHIGVFADGTAGARSLSRSREMALVAVGTRMVTSTRELSSKAILAPGHPA